MPNPFKSFASGFAKGNAVGTKSKKKEEEAALKSATTESKPETTDTVNKSYKLRKGGKVPK